MKAFGFGGGAPWSRARPAVGAWFRRVATRTRGWIGRLRGVAADSEIARESDFRPPRRADAHGTDHAAGAPGRREAEDRMDNEERLQQAAASNGHGPHEPEEVEIPDEVEVAEGAAFEAEAAREDEGAVDVAPEPDADDASWEEDPGEEGERASAEGGEDDGTPLRAEGGELARILEALIFASDEPIAIDRLAKLVDEPDKKIVRDHVQALRDEYHEQGRGFILEEIAGAFQFRTRPIYAPWVRRLKASKPSRLSPAALETLAIVAYRQPALRQEIEDVRGVDSGAVLKNLLERRLIKIVGRKDVPGRPILYGTTREFLSVFNLKNLAALPSLRDLEELERESAEQIEMLFPERGDLGEAQELDAATAGVLPHEENGAEVVPFPGAEADEDADGAAGEGEDGAAGAAPAIPAPEPLDPVSYFADADAPPTRDAEPPPYEAPVPDESDETRDA